MLANLLLDVTAAVINGGNAFTAKLDPYADSIFRKIWIRRRIRTLVSSST